MDMLLRMTVQFQDVAALKILFKIFTRMLFVPCMFFTLWVAVTTVF